MSIIYFLEEGKSYGIKQLTPKKEIENAREKV
nr:hypothetical protein BSM_02410 [uncultured archaeon]